MYNKIGPPLDWFLKTIYGYSEAEIVIGSGELWYFVAKCVILFQGPLTICILQKVGFYIINTTDNNRKYF